MHSLKITDLTFRFGDGEDLLSLPSLTLSPGELLLVVGPSGSGKSTLLDLITGVRTPTTGGIAILGEEIHKLSPGKRDRFRGRSLGYIFQNHNLIPYLSILENITAPYHIAGRPLEGSPEEEARRIARSLNIEPLLSRRPAALSTGESQRVAAARALLGTPALVVGDEPTASLDPENRDRFMDRIVEISRERMVSVVIASHDPQLQKYATKMLKLRSGSPGEVVE